MNADEYAELINNVPCVVYRCLADSDWTMQFISSGILELSGYPPADFVANRTRSFASIIHADDVKLVDDTIQAALERRQDYDIEYRIVHRDGEVRWVHERGKGSFDGDGNVIHLDGAIIDISLRRVAEDNLLDEREKFHQVIANIPGVVYRTLLGDTWTVDFVSEGVRDLLGVGPEKIIGQDLSVYAQIVHADDRDMVAQIIFDAVRQGQPYEVKYRVLATGQSVRWVIEKGRASGRDERGNRYLWGVIFDISRLRAAEREIEALKKKLLDD